MEPVTLTAAAIATTIATIFLTKPIEKIAENVGDVIWTRSDKLIKKLRTKKKAPSLTAAVDANDPQRLNYGEAILELKAAADADPEIAQAVLDVEAAAKAEPTLTQKIQEIENTLKSQEPTIQNLTQLAEKIGVVNQGLINNQTNNLNF